LDQEPFWLRHLWSRANHLVMAMDLPTSPKVVLSCGDLTTTVPASSHGSEGRPRLQDVAVERSIYLELTEDASAPIVFGWWPRRAPWHLPDMCERMTRCLPAVRPKLDLVVLPDEPHVMEHWRCWSEMRGLGAWQVAFVSSRSPAEALLEAMASLAEHLDVRSCLFYPMYLTSEMQAMSRTLGFRGAVGDAMDHPICELANAKAWLHPHICPEKRTGSLRDLAGSAARGPLGYIASSPAELNLAFRTLRSELPECTKLVLKPSWASGGEGIVLDVSAEQLERFDFPDRPDCLAVLEEMIEGGSSLISPTIYMVGGEPCGGLADQILGEGGAVNLGNRWPSTLPDCVTESGGLAALALQEQWQLGPGRCARWGRPTRHRRHQHGQAQRELRGAAVGEQLRAAALPPHRFLPHADRGQQSAPV